MPARVIDNALSMRIREAKKRGGTKWQQLVAIINKCGGEIVVSYDEIQQAISDSENKVVSTRHDHKNRRIVFRVINKPRNHS